MIDLVLGSAYWLGAWTTRVLLVVCFGPIMAPVWCYYAIKNRVCR